MYYFMIPAFSEVHMHEIKRSIISQMEHQDDDSILDQFFMAAAQGNLLQCQTLFHNNSAILADLNVRRYSLTPLCCAAQAGKLSVVKWLLENGAGIDRQDGKGELILTHIDSWCVYVHLPPVLL